MAAKRFLPVFIKTFERFRASKLAAKMASGVFWLSAGSVPSRIATLIATFLVIRILGKFTYGEFTLVRSTVNAFVTVASFGMGRTAAKYVSELLVTNRERVGRIVALNYTFTFISSLVIAVFFYVSAPWLCQTLIDAPHLVSQARFSSILLILTAMAGAQTGVLTGFQSYKEIAFSLTISGFASIPFYICGAKFWGLTGAVVGVAFGPFFNCVCNSYFIFRLLNQHGVSYQFRDCWREAVVLWNFCMPSTLMSLLMSLVTWGASVMLVRQQDGTGELGVFDAARQVQTAVLYFPVLAANVVIPALSELNALNDSKRYHKTVKYTVMINAGFTLIAALALAPFAKLIMGSFGNEFELGAKTLLVLLGGSVVMSVSNVYASVLTSIGALWTRFWLAVIWGTIVIVGMWSGHFLFSGSLGLANAMLLAYTVQTLCMKWCIGTFFKRNRLT